MPATTPTILATSMGFVPKGPGSDEFVPGPIFDLAYELAGNPARPKLCCIDTAQGDDTQATARIDGILGSTHVDMSRLRLFTMPNVENIRDHLLAQDVIWVGGGSVANLLAVWRVHGLDTVLHEAWQRGVVLSGVSAGSICWHVGGTTDSFGLELRPVTNGLAYLPYSNGVHYDSETQRRPLFHQLIATEVLPAGYATDDGVGLVYRGTEMVEAVADRPNAAAYFVERMSDGSVQETRIEPRLLTRGS